MFKEVFWKIVTIIVYVAFMVFEGVTRLALAYCICAGVWLAIIIHSDIKVPFAGIEMTTLRLMIFFATFVWLPNVYQKYPWLESFATCEQKLRGM